MPIHEYECKHCGERLEVFYFATEKVTSRKRCTCGKQAQKIVSVGAFHLMGDGWTGGLEENKSHEERKARRKSRLPRASKQDTEEVQEMLSGRAPAVQDGYTENNE